MGKNKYKLFDLKPEMIDTHKQYSKEGKCISEKIKLKYVINNCDRDKYKEVLESRSVNIDNKEFELEEYEYMCFTIIWATEV